MLDREKDGIYTTTIHGTVVGALTRQQQIDAVSCHICSAPRGSACTGDQMRGNASHPERRREAMRFYGIRPPQAVLSGKQIDNWYKRFRKYAKGDLEASPPPQPQTRAKRKQPSVRASEGLTVRYECPLCGGPHARVDHPSLKAIIARRRAQRAS